MYKRGQLDSGNSHEVSGNHLFIKIFFFFNWNCHHATSRINFQPANWSDFYSYTLWQAFTILNRHTSIRVSRPELPWLPQQTFLNFKILQLCFSSSHKSHPAAMDPVTLPSVSLKRTWICSAVFLAVYLAVAGWAKDCQDTLCTSCVAYLCYISHWKTIMSLDLCHFLNKLINAAAFLGLTPQSLLNLRYETRDAKAIKTDA